MMRFFLCLLAIAFASAFVAPVSNVGGSVMARSAQSAQQPMMMAAKKAAKKVAKKGGNQKGLLETGPLAGVIDLIQTLQKLPGGRTTQLQGASKQAKKAANIR